MIYQIFNNSVYTVYTGISGFKAINQTWPVMKTTNILIVGIEVNLDSRWPLSYQMNHMIWFIPFHFEYNLSISALYNRHTKNTIIPSFDSLERRFQI